MGEEKSSKGGCLGWFLVIIVLAAIVAGIVIAFRSKFHHSDKPEPVPGPPGAIVTKYSDALKLAMQFFDVQKCEFSMIPSFFSSNLIGYRIYLQCATVLLSNFLFFFLH